MYANDSGNVFCYSIRGLLQVPTVVVKSWQQVTAFKLLSLNARGIRSFEKRKAVFGWVMRQQVDICFIQETYSTKEVENVWKKQWKGEMYFSHGSVHSRGVLVLIKNSLEFQIKSMRQDKEGRLPCCVVNSFK